MGEFNRMPSIITSAGAIVAPWKWMCSHMHHPHTCRVIDQSLYCTAPHRPVPQGIIAGHTYPLLAEHVAEFLAATLFSTSLLSLTSAEHKCVHACTVALTLACLLGGWLLGQAGFARTAAGCYRRTDEELGMSMANQ